MPVRAMIEGQFKCTQCSVWKNPDCFHQDKAVSSGRTSWCKECVSAKARMRKYGVSDPPTECELCGSEGPLVVDHDHECCPGIRTCGKCIRGWLCHGCNTGLGKLGDSVVSLEKALQYLLKSKNLLF